MYQNYDERVYQSFKCFQLKKDLKKTNINLGNIDTHDYYQEGKYNYKLYFVYLLFDLFLKKQ